MPVLDGRENYFSGVPLGGIGAGKMELLPSGLFNAFSFLNNWTQPLNGQGSFPGVLGYHLGVFAQEEGSEPKAYLLQTVPVADLPTVRDISYEGYFPGKIMLSIDSWPWLMTGWSMLNVFYLRDCCRSGFKMCFGCLCRSESSILLLVLLRNCCLPLLTIRD